MPQNPEKFFLTTPIYYVNARPHIGHAYTTIVADVLARRSRAQGKDTFFLTGTDEHGQKIERSAQAAGISPQHFTDQVSAEFERLWHRMGLTNDDFIRTTSDRHKRGAQKLFALLYERGSIYLDSYTGQYCVSEEIFVEGPPGTIGPDGKPTETVTEENFFFRLSDYQLPLLNLIESDTLHIQPDSRKNEVLSFLRGNVSDAVAAGIQEVGGIGEHQVLADPALKSGKLRQSASGNLYVPGALRDLSVSRSSFTWGIPVPEPAASAASKPHVMYVWLDALANYMTALGYGSDDESLWQKFWPADIHLMSKEITRQHCIYWPAFLLAAGLPLPKSVVAHGWLLFEDSKMSKSKGNIVRTETILDAFGPLCPPPVTADELRKGTPSGVPQTRVLEEVGPSGPTKPQQDLFAADILRYFLLREIPFGQDGSFSFDALITRYNADLANGYGNLVSRTLKMIETSLSGDAATGYPAGAEAWDERLWLEHARTRSTSETTSATMSDILRQAASCAMLADAQNFAEMMNTFTAQVQLLVKVTDGYLSDKAPWKLAKDPTPAAQAELAEVLYTAAESIRIITVLLYPILPYAAASVWAQLGLDPAALTTYHSPLFTLQWGGLKPGTKLGPLSPIFPRADKGLAQIMIDMESPKPLSAITDQSDATHPATSDFPVEPIASEPPSHDPAAGPRTASLAEPNPGLQVAGSTADTTERPGTPPHSEASASGIFAGAPADSSPQITIDDFAKVELRVAQILVCERIPKADKLLRLEVDLGYEKRQILSGIAEWYTPEDLIGRRIVVITNLAPRKMRGLESHGMLLAASSEGGKPALATFLDADTLPLGSRLK